VNQPSIETRQVMVQRKGGLLKAFSVIQRYGLAILSVFAALGVSLAMQRYNFRAEFTPFLLAVAVAAWYAGSGPGVIALILSSALFDYFFTEPLYTLYVTASDVPRFLLFLGFLSLITWFSAVRRRLELELRQAVDELEREVAERRALNEELAKRSDELQAINKELEAFAYSVSHDLRAPIRHISGFTELLQKNVATVVNDRGQRHMSMILESAKRMGNLIDDLLAFSRIGRAETHKTMVSLQQLVQEAQSELAQETEGRNIDWKVGKLPACYGDRSMLRLVLVNLISNAVKFTRTRPQAEIEIGSTNHKPDQIVMFIKDNGVGFDMKYVNKLFGVFQRLHAPEAFEGTGIGLATVQRIVHRHGGTAWAEAALDKGATFYFSLSKSGEHDL
jgi:light-regulated signal transduction histidine kinase (bacteriophytochrome)